ncbi:hypothetical protein HPB47_024339, partial [Ixodes persulcatus]
SDLGLAASFSDEELLTLRASGSESVFRPTRPGISGGIPTRSLELVRESVTTSGVIVLAGDVVQNKQGVSEVETRIYHYDADASVDDRRYGGPVAVSFCAQSELQ